MKIEIKLDDPISCKKCVLLGSELNIDKDGYDNLDPYCYLFSKFLPLNFTRPQECIEKNGE